jgi:hypothetical protein
MAKPELTPVTANVMGASQGILGLFETKHNWDKQNAAIDAYNAQKRINDANTRKKLAITQQFGREDFVNTEKMKLRNDEISAETSIANNLKKLREVSTAKASGLPSGNSTNNLIRQVEGANVREQTAFMRDMDVQNEQLVHRNTQIQQGLDMAYIDAMASINSTQFQDHLSKEELYMGYAGNIMQGATTAVMLGGLG